MGNHGNGCNETEITQIRQIQIQVQSRAGVAVRVTKTERVTETGSGLTKQNGCGNGSN